MFGIETRRIILLYGPRHMKDATPPRVVLPVRSVCVVHPATEGSKKSFKGSFTRNDSGRAHWIPNEGRGCAHRADAGTPRSQLYVYALRGPCLWSFDKRTGPIWGPMLCMGTLLLTLS